ncbi:MAG TPA: hypothetical protein VM492_11905, partial [Sumerlaeia bacterium]|nr:hypothetical protein [Sumerlaeia bacterium]
MRDRAIQLVSHGRRMPVLAILCAATVALLPATASADVLVLKTGERLEGIVLPAPGDPDAVLFQDRRPRVKIPRANIQSLEEEPDAVDWRRIGDQNFAAKRYRGALRAYRKSLEFEPGNAEVEEKQQAAEAAITRVSAMERDKDLAKVDEMLRRAEERIGAMEFAAAERILFEEVPARDSSEKQDQQVLGLRKKLLKAWGMDRIDKLLPEEGAKHLEKLLDLDPTDEEAYAALIEIWSKMPEKNEQVINALAMNLKLHPDDLVTRKKLADKYYEQSKILALKEPEKALECEDGARREYETLYQSGEFKNSEIEANLIALTSGLVRRAEARQDYDTAIAYYRRLQSYSPDFGDARIREMEFFRDLLETPPDDVEARAQLVQRAREIGLKARAKQELQRLQTHYPKNETVDKIAHSFAQEYLTEARAALGALRYEEALTKALFCIREYGHMEDIKEGAEQVRGLAMVELEREKEQIRETGLDWKDLADKHFGMGRQSMNAMRDRTLDRESSRIVNDKQDAIRNFGLAIRYYVKALEKLGSTEPVAREEIRQSLKMARGFL